MLAHIISLHVLRESLFLSKLALKRTKPGTEKKQNAGKRAKPGTKQPQTSTKTEF